MKPARPDVAQAMQSASSYGFHEIESLLVCVQAAVDQLIDEIVEASAMDQAAVNRTLDVVLVIDTALDVVLERLAERRDAIEAIYYRHLRPDDVAFITGMPRRRRGRAS